MGNFADLGKYQFVTVDKDGLIGSVYFEKGRIRLIHDYGPCVYFDNDISKESLDADVVSVEVKRYLLVASSDKTQYPFNFVAAKGMAAKGVALYERFEYLDAMRNVLATGDHESRGCPCVDVDITKTLLKHIEEVFDKLNDEDYRLAQTEFTEAKLRLSNLEFVSNLSFYKIVSKMSNDIFILLKGKYIHNPTEYGLVYTGKK